MPDGQLELAWAATEGRTPRIAGLLVQQTTGGWAVGAFAAAMAVAAVLCRILQGLRKPESPTAAPG